VDGRQADGERRRAGAVEPAGAGLAHDQGREVPRPRVGEHARRPVDDDDDDGGEAGAVGASRERVQPVEHAGRVAPLEQHGPGHAPELGHRRRGVQAVPDAVADHQRPAVGGEVDDVVPVAADRQVAGGGDVAGGHGRHVVDRLEHRRLQGVADEAVLAHLGGVPVGHVQRAVDRVRQHLEELDVGLVEGTDRARDDDQRAPQARRRPEGQHHARRGAAVGVDGRPPGR
jgi:hypothetical protein